METNFKVDVPSFALGYSAGKKKGGGDPVIEKDVNFYDYDGTLLHSFTVEEAQKLTALPKLPEQPGLICQEWNWTLDEIKERNGEVDVGATYTTDDGTTRLYIEIAEEGRMTFSFTMEASDVVINWGDGTPPEPQQSNGRFTASHTYTNPGEYVISIDCITLSLGKNSTSYNFMGIPSDSTMRIYYNMLKKVELGNNYVQILSGTFQGFTNLESVTIPKTVNKINQYAFANCSKLASVTIPNNVTAILTSAFNECYGLKTFSMANSVTTLGSTVFEKCYLLGRVIISKGITSIANSAIQSCYGLVSMTIPSTVTSVGNSAFKGCNNLARLIISNGVATIVSYAFSSCVGLSYIKIPNTVSTINSYTFQDCKGLRIVDFTDFLEVPALNSSNAFSGVPSDCEIRVPGALYDEWISATNWSSSSVASKIVAV